MPIAKVAIALCWVGSTHTHSVGMGMVNPSSSGRLDRVRDRAFVAPGLRLSKLLLVGSASADRFLALRCRGGMQPK